MTFASMTHGAAFAAILVAGMTVGSPAPTSALDLQKPTTILAQATQYPMPGEAEDGEDGEAPGQPGMMDGRMMPDGMMPGRMMPGGMMPGGMMPGGMMEERMHGPMHGPMMKIMFAIADANGDGMLSFEEVMALHKRIFDAMDTNKDGKLTLVEIQTFMRN